MPQPPNIIANTEGMINHVKQGIEQAKNQGLKVTMIEVRFIASDDVATNGPKFYAGDTTIRVQV